MVTFLDLIRQGYYATIRSCACSIVAAGYRGRALGAAPHGHARTLRSASRSASSCRGDVDARATWSSATRPTCRSDGSTSRAAAARRRHLGRSTRFRRSPKRHRASRRRRRSKRNVWLIGIIGSAAPFIDSSAPWSASSCAPSITWRRQIPAASRWSRRHPEALVATASVSGRDHRGRLWLTLRQVRLADLGTTMRGHHVCRRRLP